MTDNGKQAKTKHRQLTELQSSVSTQILGQSTLVERVLVALLADGHVLLEGVPGLAKTLLVKTVAQAVAGGFARVQFTPDLLPADLIGTQIYNPHEHAFSTHQGPIFTNFLLADEINRAPAKVQSALLEAMQERQVTIGDTTFRLEEPFMVLATQNPIEQEGTYPLPEAQLDRFLFKLTVTYPDYEAEREIMQRMSGAPLPKLAPVLTPAELLALREKAQAVFVDERIETYILNLVRATRPECTPFADVKRLVEVGASPRASINLMKATKALAFLQGRNYVVPDDVKALAGDVLRHRLVRSFEAEAEAVTADSIITHLLNKSKIP